MPNVFSLHTGTWYTWRMLFAKTSTPWGASEGENKGETVDTKYHGNNYSIGHTRKPGPCLRYHKEGVRSAAKQRKEMYDSRSIV